MRARLIRLSCLLSVLISASASAVTMDWTPIGNPGNPADTTGRGAVAYAYNIGTYEVTNEQYVEFLNAKAASDPLGLYNTNMASRGNNGGITRSGTSGSYTYSAVRGREDMPVNLVSWYDATRFANWMNNGQGTGDTETGAYTLLGGTPTPSNDKLTRNAGARIVLTSENEWYKAAYYDSASSSYFAYPAGSNAQPTCAPGTPTAAPNSINCGSPGIDLTPKGSYPGSASPYGTFDQGGNVWEWTDTLACCQAAAAVTRGGSFSTPAYDSAANYGILSQTLTEDFDVGFRLVLVPEPSTGLLVFAGLLGLAGWRRGRA